MVWRGGRGATSSAAADGSDGNLRYRLAEPMTETVRKFWGLGPGTGYGRWPGTEGASKAHEEFAVGFCRLMQVQLKPSQTIGLLCSSSSSLSLTANADADGCSWTVRDPAAANCQIELSQLLERAAHRAARFHRVYKRGPYGVPGRSR